MADKAVYYRLDGISRLRKFYNKIIIEENRVGCHSIFAFYAHGCGKEGCSASCPHPARRAGEEESSLLDCTVTERKEGLVWEY